MIYIEISLSSRRWFDNQKQVAQWLGIKNTSKKALQARCKKLNFTIHFNN